jgi:hypothetical protein
MKSRWVIAVVVAVLVAAGAAAWWMLRSGDEPGGGFAACVKAGNPVGESYPRQCRDSTGNVFTENVTGAGFTSEHGVKVELSAPKSGAVVPNPVQVKGKVPGSWSFEANFGVELLDANRTSVATGYATVEGNWMTEKDVTFTGLLPFKPPASKTGFLVLHKANPSDTEGQADSVEIPIRFR